MPECEAEATFTVLATHPSEALIFALCAAGHFGAQRAPLAHPDTQHGIDVWFKLRRNSVAAQLPPADTARAG